MNKIKVFLADYQMIFREGMHFILSEEEDIEIIGEAVRSDEALAFIENVPADVIVLNAGGPSPTGMQVAKRIRSTVPKTKVVHVMDAYDTEQLFEMIKNGASGYLTKDSNHNDLVNVIRNSAQGKYPVVSALLDADIASKVYLEFGKSAEVDNHLGDAMAALIPLEEKILKMLAEGSGLSEVSTALDNSEETILQYLNTIMVKLINNSRIQAVVDRLRNTPGKDQIESETATEKPKAIGQTFQVTESQPEREIEVREKASESSLTLRELTEPVAENRPQYAEQKSQRLYINTYEGPFQQKTSEGLR